LDRETVRKIFTEDLGMRKVSAKMVPWILSGDHKQQQLDICCDLSRQLAEGNNFLDTVITGAFSTIQNRNAKACNGKHQRHRDQKKARMSWAQVKTMLICFFYHKGIVHFAFLEQGQTVNQHCYLEILARLC
jgi:hypothetical protein